MIQASLEVIETAFLILVRGAEASVEKQYWQNELDRYDARTSAMLNSAYEIGRCVTLHIAKLNAGRNALAPIHKLPTELLFEIFRRALPAQWEVDFVGRHRDVPTFYTFLYDLMLVCKHWRSILQAGPSFWNYVSVYAHPRFNARALSSEVPLIIDCYIPYHDITRKQRRELRKSEINRFAKTIELHVDRWSDVRIVLNEIFDMSVFYTALQAAAPSLEELWLQKSRRSNDTNPEPLELFAGELPKLTRLQVRGMSVHLDPLTLSKVQKVVLVNIPQTALSLRHLVQLLQAWTNLHNLELGHMDLDDEVEGPGEPFSHLSSLTSFELRYLSPHAFQVILPQIPNLSLAKELILVIKLPFDTTAEVMKILHAFHAHLPTIRRMADETYDAGNYTEVSIGLCNGVFVNSRTTSGINSGISRLEIALTELQTAPTLVLEWLRTILAGCSSKTSLPLTLWPGFGWSNLDYLRSLVDLNVEYLRVHDGQEFGEVNVDQRALFEYLGTPLVQDDNVSWPLPHLRTLELWIMPLDMEAFCKMLRCRYKPITPEVRDQQTPSALMRLEHLELWNHRLDDEGQAEIRLILGEDVVIEVHAPQTDAIGSGEGDGGGNEDSSDNSNEGPGSGDGEESVTDANGEGSTGEDDETEDEGEEESG